MRTLTCLLVLALSSFPVSAGAAPCGDQNGDGKLDVTDIIAIHEAAEGEQPAGNCDATGDGVCDEGDVQAVRDAILGRCTPVCAARPAPPAGDPPACPVVP